MKNTFRILYTITLLSYSIVSFGQQAETAKGQYVMQLAKSNYERFTSQYGGVVISAYFLEEFALTVPYCYKTVIKFPDNKSYTSIKTMTSKFYGVYTDWKENYSSGKKYHTGTFCSYSSDGKKLIEYEYLFSPSKPQELIISTHPDYNVPF